MRDLARIFKALGDETRLRLLALLLHHGELCVCDCEQALAITQSKASRHLRYLAAAGLVEDRREQVWMYYRIATKPSASRGLLLETLRAILTPDLITEAAARLAVWRKLKAESAQAACPTTAALDAALAAGGPS